jgi:signal transduction histidine kinase/DNA-binding response OmpR family regulator
MPYQLLILILILNGFVLSGQNNKIDSLKSVIKTSNDTTKVNAIIQLSMAYRDSDLVLAKNHAQEALDLSISNDYINGTANAFYELGKIESQKGNYAEALDFFIKSMNIYVAMPNVLQVAYINNDIGGIYAQMAEYEKGLEYLVLAKTQFEEIQNEEGLADALNNVGIVFDMQNEFEKAIIYYEKALKWYVKIDKKQKYANTYMNLGALYGIQGNYERSISLIRQSQKTYLDIDDYYGLAGSWVNLSEIYGKSGDYEQAVEAGVNGLTLALENDYNRWVLQSCKYLASNYAALKNYEKAFQYSQLLIDFKENTYNDQKARLITEMDTKYQTEKKEQEILALEQQKQTAEFRRNTYLASGLLIAIILFLLYHKQRQKSRKNQILFEKEQEVTLLKSQFFENVSHEFRTPLTLILGPMQLLKSNIADAKMSRQLGIMERNAQRLLSLINKLLDFSKVESGEDTLEITNSDIVSVVKGVTMSFQSKAEEKQLELEVSSNLNEHNTYFDLEKIETILINLISNAFKFTPENGHVKVSLEIFEDNQQKEHCKIIVTDTGQGIPDTDIKNIFNRFYQSTNPRDGKYDGSGIGLALTQELVKLHKGSIEAVSKEDQGTSITVLFPIGKSHFNEKELANKNSTVLVENQPVYDPISEVKPPIVSNTNLPILLLVEDNADVMHYLKEILEDSYEILEASNGVMGIEMAIETIPDMIVSDVMMPKMNGYEVCETLKQDEKTSHIPIILLTAKASQEDKMQGLLTKADAYLTKPFAPKELLVRVQNLIESRKKLREKYKRELILKPSEVSVNSIDENFLLKVMKVVDENLDDESFNMDKLGQGVGMSRSQIHRKLQALTNQSATQFIRSYRLDRAMDLIKKNAGSVSEIAYSVGFSDPSYFSKSFQQQFNKTPTEAKDKPS